MGEKTKRRNGSKAKTQTNSLYNTKNLEFKHRKFSMTEIDGDAVYLTEDEIMKLYKHEFKEVKRLVPVKDLFVFACLVGLRFSDYSTVFCE